MKKTVILIALIFFLGVYFLIKTATWSIPDEFDRLTIRNGTTGDFYEVVGEDLTDFCNRMESVTFRRSEFCGLRMGFMYHLIFYKGDKEIDSITVKGENMSYRPLCIYRTSENMLTLIEGFLGDLD